jgi:hypothetical protein
MNLSDTEGKSLSGAVVSSIANTGLSGSWLIIARAVWLALVIPSLGLFVVGLLVYYQQLQTACIDPVMCNVVGAQIAKILHALTTLGFSVSGYAAFFTIFFVIIASLWGAVGFLLPRFKSMSSLQSHLAGVELLLYMRRLPLIAPL